MDSEDCVLLGFPLGIIHCKNENCENPLIDVSVFMKENGKSLPLK